MPGDKDIILLQRRLDDHIEQFNSHVAEENDRWAHLIDVTERNTESITKLAKSTEGLVDAWVTTNNVGRFIKWISGFAFLGAIGAWLVQHWPIK